MDKNNSDIFESTEKNSFHEATTPNENFFMAENSSLFKQNYTIITDPIRRLNDYDANILEKDAYKDIDNDLFKLEYKISRLEDEIKDYESQIQAANDINDYNLAQDLILRKNALTADYKELLSVYNDKSFSARISDTVSNLFNNKTKKTKNNFQKKLVEKIEKFVEKIPGQLSVLLEIKRSLNKLENINKSVSELTSLNIPYGENINKYEQLSKYIIKANAIQSNISKVMKNK